MANLTRIRLRLARYLVGDRYELVRRVEIVLPVTEKYRPTFSSDWKEEGGKAPPNPPPPPKSQDRPPDPPPGSGD